MRTRIQSIDEVTQSLAGQGYICSEQIATTIYLAAQLRKPVLIEGPPGVGKTELVKAAAGFLQAPLIRLQCYEGLDEARALYEWKYGKQLLYTQLLKEKLGDLLQGADTLDACMDRLVNMGDAFYDEAFLEPRPLLQALRSPEAAVLLIDEVDKSDQEFEAFLLELLADYQITIPELGTVTARAEPLVLLTSNDSRELSDALKRRCLHLHIPFPEQALEEKIVASRIPEVEENLRKQLVTFVQALRELDLRKQPAVSETLDWARALVLLHASHLSAELLEQTLNILLKYEEDIQFVQKELPGLLKGV